MTRPSREMSRQGNAFRGRVSQGSVLGEVSVGELFSGGGGTVRIPFKKAWTTLRGYFFVNIFFITRKLITMTHSSVAKSLSRN